MGLGPSHPIGLLGPTGPLLGLYPVNPDRNPNPLAPTPPHVATPPSRSDLDRDRSRAPDASHRHTHRASILLRDATSPAQHLPASSSLSRLDLDRGKPPDPVARRRDDLALLPRVPVAA